MPTYKVTCYIEAENLGKAENVADSLVFDQSAKSAIVERYYTDAEIDERNATKTVMCHAMILKVMCGQSQTRMTITATARNAVAVSIERLIGAPDFIPGRWSGG